MKEKKPMSWERFILILLFFPFVFTYWALTHQGWDKNKKLLVLFAGWGGMVLLVIMGFVQNERQTLADKEQAQWFQTMTTNYSVNTPTPILPTPTPIAKYSLSVTSDIVKRISSDTYRYFFQVKDTDSRDFKGVITIQLFDGNIDTITNQGHWLILGGADTSFSDNPIQVGLNSIIAVDDSHAPYQIAGTDGATTFSYTAKVGDTEVSSGKGDITSSYEDTLNEQ